ncbi:YkgJ family cysteine cluster protein (plasmid) [Methylomonas sp. 2BW1-5-20]|uniref:YkgJ family cysteine cluster protein n=1 Tax=Methylomonas sp. 2BW1-5-20 TaxID=3376686 RepID=UPI00404BC1C8
MNKELELEQENARKNSEIVIIRLPNRLAKREGLLLTKFFNHQGNPLTKLKDLYSFMDELFSFVHQFTPCKKGCSSCCYYDVSISELEIQYIEGATKIKRSKNPKQSSSFHGTPCPFLKAGVCSIYEYRPFFCRQHVALTRTSIWCHPDKCGTGEFTLLKFSEILRSYNFIIRENDNASIFDIRQIFQ